MFVKDIKNDFYNKLLGNRVLLLVHYDVDAVCACKILQSLFKCDNILYTLIPVGGISELKSAYEENHEEIRYVVLVNCGGTIDLVDILQPEEEVVFFVIDSHKPTNVCNVYSDGQVRLVWKDEEEDIPNFDDIFRDDEDEEEEPSSENLEETITRRRQKRAWEENRDKLMFEYTKFSYYGQPSSCTVCVLAWKLSRLSVELGWSSVVGLLSADVGCTRSPTQQLLARHELTSMLQQTGGEESATICLEKDLWLPLYRLWSLESALRYSPTAAPRLKMHTRAGDIRLRKLFADTGIPLQQARQAYRSMDVSLRNSLLEALEGDRVPGLTQSGFLLKRRFSPTLAAHDMVYILLALLENDKFPKAEGFSLALDALSVWEGESSRQLGSDLAKSRLRHISSIVSSSVLNLAGPFTYLIVQEGTLESSSVSGPHWLSVCGRWVSASSPARPLLLSAPRPPSHCLLAGIPPRQEPHNLFGAAFEQAATSSGCSVSLDHLDSSVVTLPTSQRAQFLDALTHLLT